MGGLVKRDDLSYQKFTDVPFAGKVTGKQQGSFKNGKRDVLWVKYYKDGKLSGKRIYTFGRKQGPWIYYYRNSHLSMKDDYKELRAYGPCVGYKSDRTVNENFTGTLKGGMKVDKPVLVKSF